MSESSDVDEKVADASTRAAATKPPARAVRYPARLASSGWPIIAALTIAVIAAVLAGGAWLYPRHTATRYTDQQRTDARTHICSAYSVVHQGVVTNTHLANPLPGNPAGQLAVAANARLALLGGGAFLQAQLAAEPATPPELANAATAFAGSVEELGVGYLAGRDSTLEPVRHTLDTEITQLTTLCSS